MKDSSSHLKGGSAAGPLLRRLLALVLFVGVAALVLRLSHTESAAAVGRNSQSDAKTPPRLAARETTEGQPKAGVDAGKGGGGGGREPHELRPAESRRANRSVANAGQLDVDRTTPVQLVADTVVTPPVPAPTTDAVPLSSDGFPNSVINRAPPRPRLSAGGAAGRSPPPPPSPYYMLPTAVFNAESWSVSGAPVRSPRWAVDLLQSVEKESWRVAAAQHEEGDRAGGAAAAAKPHAHDSVEAFISLAEDPWRIVLGFHERALVKTTVGLETAAALRLSPPKPRQNKTAVVPPLTGADARFAVGGREFLGAFHAEYNASWHVGLKSERGGGPARHFQMVHRNALAECYRAGLDVYAFHVSPRARGEGDAVGAKEGDSAAPHQPSSSTWSRPLPVYYCCKAAHCSGKDFVGWGGPAGGRAMTEVFPSYTSPFLTYGGAVVPKGVKPLEAGSYPPTAPALLANPAMLDVIECLPPRSAPWLVTAAVVPKFPYEGLHDDLDALLAVQADANGAVMVTMLNTMFVDHLHNFIFSLVHRAKFSNFIVAAIDSDSLRMCVAARLPCFNAIRYAEALRDMHAGGRGQAHFKRGRVTNAMGWVKPRLTLAVLQRGYHCLMADVDMALSMPFMRDVVSLGLDFAHQCDPSGFTSYADSWEVNTGFYLARSNPRTVRLFHNLLLATAHEISDQKMMQRLFTIDHTLEVDEGCLDPRLYAGRCDYKYVKNPNAAAAATAHSWDMFNPHRGSFRWSFLHVTCEAEMQPKLRYLRAANAWFVDDLDNYTLGAAPTIVRKFEPEPAAPPPAEGTYCVMDLAGRRFAQSRRISTPHSAMYTYALDQDVWRT